MGLFDFFKRDKGKEIFKADDAAEAKAAALRAEIKRLGLPGDITVKVDGSKVKIGGNVPDQATKEKLMVLAGNTRHIDQVDDDDVKPTAAPAPAAKPGRFHTVESGDTLSKIAKEVYGDPMQYSKIFEANKPMLKDADEIYPGQVLRIPG